MAQEHPDWFQWGILSPIFTHTTRHRPHGKEDEGEKTAGGSEGGRDEEGGVHPVHEGGAHLGQQRRRVELMATAAPWKTPWRTVVAAAAGRPVRCRRTT